MVFKQLVQLILPNCKCETMSNVVQKPKMPEFLWGDTFWFQQMPVGHGSVCHPQYRSCEKNLNSEIVGMSQDSYKFLIAQIPTARKVHIFRTSVTEYLKLDNFVVNKK